MDCSRLKVCYLVVPAAVLLLAITGSACNTDDDDDDDIDVTIVPTGSTVLAGTATVGAGGSATPASGTPATVAGQATGTPQAGATAAAGTSVSEENTVRVTLSDDAIEPATLSARPGTITFEITNDGTTVHNLALDIDDEPIVSPDVQPGESETWVIDLETTGDHALFSLVEGEKETGLNAVLTIAE